MTDYRSSGGGELIIDVAPDAATFKPSSIDISKISFAKAGNIDRAYTARDEVLVAMDVTLTTGGTLSAKNLQVGNGATFTYSDGDLKLTGKVYGEGTVNLEKVPSSTNGLSVINIGSNSASLYSLNFGGTTNNSYNIAGNVYADNTTLENSNNLVLTSNSQIYGDVTIEDSSTLDLGVHELSTKTLHMGDGVTIKLTVQDKQYYGRITVQDEKHSSFSGTNLKLEIIDNAGLSAGKTMMKIFPSDVSLLDENISYSGLNKFTYAGNGYLAMEADPEVVARHDSIVSSGQLTSGGEANIRKFLASTTKHIGDAKDFSDLLHIVYYDLGLDEEAIKKVAALLSNFEHSAALSAHTESVQAMSSLINIKISNITTTSYDVELDVESTEGAGSAAGDYVEAAGKTGVWTQGFGSRVNQKLYKEQAGYKSTIYGGVIGADTMVSEDTILGVALGYTDSNMKFKDAKAGEKVKSAVEYTSKRVIDANGTIYVDSNKYNSNSYNAEFALGRKYNVAGKFTLSPEIGVRANIFADGGYTEKGPIARSVAKKSGSKIDGLFTVLASTKFAVGSAEFSPSVKAGISHELTAKDAKTKMMLSGQAGGPTVSSGKTLNKTQYKVGANLSINYGRMEYSVGYEGVFANKYNSHSGSLKVRVNL